MVDKSIQSVNENYNSGVGVLDKVIQIISLISEESPVELTTIIERTGISRSTAHRLLQALEGHHIIRKTSNGYRLGTRIVSWGEDIKTQHLIESAKPALVKLKNQTQESTQIYVKEGNKRVCLVSIEPSTGLKNTVPVGAVYPLEAGSAGTVLSVWSGFKKEELTINKKYEAILEQGYVESIAEREEGVASISAPILDSKGHIVAAISISGPIFRLGENPAQKYKGLLLETAKEIESRLKAEG